MQKKKPYQIALMAHCTKPSETNYFLEKLSVYRKRENKSTHFINNKIRGQSHS